MTDGTIAARYRVIRELGRGGMGVVYLVEHTHTGDKVALKVLHGQGANDPEMIGRFKAEARVAARIRSEHIVKVIDADVAPELGGAPFLVMELLNGKDLDKQLKSDGRLAPEIVVQYLAQAAVALDKSHAMSIVHRDLKPENLFIHHPEDGRPILKILDFGISKIMGSDAHNDLTGAGMTRTGAVMGTPLYMSPEQARGLVSEIGPATDIWAMGIIALQLLTGEIYWQANTVADLMLAIVADPLYAPSRRWAYLSPALDAWFFRSCARDRRKRFATVGEQVCALGHALGVGVELPGRPGPPSRLPVQGGSTLADSSAPWPAVAGGGSTAVAPNWTGTPPIGRTTTGATAREAGEARGGRRPLLAGAAILLVGVIGATGWALRLTSVKPPLQPGPPPTATAPVLPSGETAPGHTGNVPDAALATTAAATNAPNAPALDGATMESGVVDAGRAQGGHGSWHPNLPQQALTTTPASTTPAAKPPGTGVKPSGPATGHPYNPSAP